MIRPCPNSYNKVSPKRQGPREECQGNVVTETRASAMIQGHLEHQKPEVPERNFPVSWVSSDPRSFKTTPIVMLWHLFCGNLCGRPRKFIPKPLQLSNV